MTGYRNKKVEASLNVKPEGSGDKIIYGWFKTKNRRGGAFLHACDQAEV